MATINLKIKSDFDQAEKDFQQLSKVSESTRKKIQKFSESFKTEQIDKFRERNKLAATAVTATRGKFAGMQAEAKGLQREMERLIKKGMAPQDKALQKLAKDYDILQKEIAQTTNATKKQQSAFAKNVKSMIATVGIISALTMGVRAVVGGYIAFDQSITSATAKFKEATKTTAEGRVVIDQLRSSARKIGAETEFSASQAAAGLDFLAMAGFTAKQSMALLPGVVDLATVANVDLARATDIASDSLGAFGLMTKDTEQLAANFTRVQDVMAKTVTTSNTNMEQLFEAIGKGAPTFTTAGQSMETFTSLIGSMAGSTLKGGEAGTNLRNIMLRLANATPAAQKELSKMNIAVKDQRGNFRDIIDIIADFEKGTQKMGTAQKTAALGTIFGAKAVTGMNILLKEGSEKLRKYRTDIENSEGAAAQMAEVMRGSLLNQFKSLGSAALELGFSFIDAFAEKGGEGIKTLTDIVRSLTPVFSALGTVFSTVMSVLPSLIAGMTAYLVVTKGAAIATGIMSVAMKAFNVVAKANPFGVIASIITAVLVPAIIWMVKNWDLVKFKVLDFALSAKIKLMEFGLVVREKVMGAIQSLLKQLAKLPKVGGYFKKIMASQNEQTASMKRQIAVMKWGQKQNRSNFRESQKQAASRIKKAKGEAAETEKANDKIVAAYKKRAQTFKQVLEGMKMSEQMVKNERIKTAQEFFLKRAELETMDGAKRIEFLMAQAQKVKDMDSLNREEKLAAEIGLRKAIEQEQAKLTANRIKAGQMILGQTGNLLSSVSQIMDNFGKKNRSLAIAMKGVAMAQAAINSFLAFTKALASVPYPFNFIAAGITLAAGIAQQAAIASTPIPSAQTGIDFTVPDSRTNKNDGAAVMASPGESVSVTPRGEDAGDGANIRIDVGEKNLFKIVERGIKTGQIDISNRNIGRGVFAT